MRAVIQSHKHYVQITGVTVGASAIGTTDIAKAEQNPDRDQADEVAVGAIVKAVYVELWATSDDAAQGLGVFTIEKRPSASPTMSYVNSTNLHDYLNKNNIFYTTQGLLGPNVQQATPFFRGWIKIPKGKQRMSIGDKLVLNYAGVATGLIFCGIIVYKDYT